MTRKSFVFYVDWEEAIDNITDPQTQLAYYRAIVKYALHGVVFALERAKRRDAPKPPQQPAPCTERIDPALLDKMIADFMKELNLGSKRTAAAC